MLGWSLYFTLVGDETKSTVSDTWSTDVLASDSEPPEQNQLERLEEVAEEMARQNLLGVQEVKLDCCEIYEPLSINIISVVKNEKKN